MSDFTVVISRIETRQVEIEVSAMSRYDALVFAEQQSGDIDFTEARVADVDYEYDATVSENEQDGEEEETQP